MLRVCGTVCACKRRQVVQLSSIGNAAIASEQHGRTFEVVVKPL
jgi:hypothetical protein